MVYGPGGVRVRPYNGPDSVIAAAMAGFIAGFAAAVLHLAFFAGEVEHDMATQCSHVVLSGDDYVVATKLLLGVPLVAAVVTALYRGHYRIGLWALERKLRAQGWRTASAAVREYASNPGVWAKGLSLEVPR